MGYSKLVDVRGQSDRIGRIKVVLWAILGLNLAVALAKLAWGTVSGSVAMQADGFHSLFDGTSNVVGLIGMRLAARPADKDHPYGHGKYETYASAAIGAMLVFAAFRVGSSAIERLAGAGGTATVSLTSFGVMIGTLAVNLFVTWWERREGRKLGSAILVADASHTASDAFVSIGVIVGLICVKAGFAKADAITALLVTAAIVYTAWRVFREASVTLSDASRMDASKIRAAVLEVPGVLGCHNVRTRGSEAEVYVDLHIQVDPSSTVAEGHAIAEAAERAVAGSFEHVVDVIAHLEPLDEYQEQKTEAQRDSGLV